MTQDTSTDARLPVWLVRIAEVRRIASRLGPYLLFVPGVALILTIKVIPLVRGMATSMTAPKDIFTSEYVGLANYARMLHDTTWLNTLRNAGRLFLTLPIFVAIPLILAAILFSRVPAWKSFRATFFMSWLLPPLSVGYMFTPVFGTNGPVNRVLGELSVNWLGSPSLAPIVIVSVLLWSWFGLGTVIYLAGLATLSVDILDAARIDGARSWALLRWVQIPHLLPTIAFWSVLCTANMLLNAFPYIYTLTEGGPGDATRLPEYYVWQTLGFFDPGYTSTLGLTLFALIAVIVSVQVRLLYMQASDE